MNMRSARSTPAPAALFPTILLLSILALRPGPAQAQESRVAFETEFPRTLVFIAESGEGQVAAGDLTDFLREAGFPLIDPALAHTHAQRELVRQALEGDEGAATELGRDFGAQLLVIGRADWGARPDPLDQSAVTATSEVSIRALRLDRGEVVATARADARRLEATEQAARTGAVREATGRILNSTGFLGQVLNDWAVEPWQDALYWKPDPGSVPAGTGSAGGSPAGAASAAGPAAAGASGSTTAVSASGTPGGAAAGEAAGGAGRSGPGLAILRADVAPSTEGATRGLGVVKRGSRSSSVFNPVVLEGVVVGETLEVDVEGRPAALGPLRDGEARQLGLEGREAQRFRAETSLPLSQDTIHVTATGSDGGVTRALAAPRINDRWAVIVGIGEYEAGDIPDLEYARGDAQAMYDFLTSEAAGPFDPDKILFLSDEEATGAAMREAMFVFLQQAKWDDLVVIYYAGHGAPDPNRPGNLYLLPHDSDLGAMASTAFPMWDVKTALRRQIAAERVIVIADACHSAGTGADDFDGGSNAIADGFTGLFSPSRRLTITAAGADEYSFEDARWGGHGVFTHFLLDALRGSGDLDGDGIVTFNEAYEFVAGRVVEATNGRQNPQRAGWGDVPLAVVEADR